MKPIKITELPSSNSLFFFFCPVMLAINPPSYFLDLEMSRKCSSWLRSQFKCSLTQTLSGTFSKIAN
jgi:hypothetical protein